MKDPNPACGNREVFRAVFARNSEAAMNGDNSTLLFTPSTATYARNPVSYMSRKISVKTPRSGE